MSCMGRDRFFLGAVLLVFLHAEFSGTKFNITCIYRIVHVWIEDRELYGTLARQANFCKAPCAPRWHLSGLFEHWGCSKVLHVAPYVGVIFR